MEEKIVETPVEEVLPQEVKEEEELKLPQQAQVLEQVKEKTEEELLEEKEKEKQKRQRKQREEQLMQAQHRPVVGTVKQMGSALAVPVKYFFDKITSSVFYNTILEAFVGKKDPLDKTNKLLAQIVKNTTPKPSKEKDR